MFDHPGAMPVFLRLLGFYGICLVAGFAMKRLARSLRPLPAAAFAAAPKGPGIGRKFKVFFAFQITVLSLSFWSTGGMAVFLLLLLALSLFEMEALRKSSASRPGYPFPHVPAYGLLFLFAASGACCVVFGPLLEYWFLRGIMTGGSPFLAFLLLLVAVFDGYSQICGEIFGGPRMVPRISPGKTWSGFAGGLAFCLAAAFLGGLFLQPFLDPARNLAVGAAVGLLAFAGDISASWVKRRIGVKDFSDWLGPQGGVLDRADSLLWLGPGIAAAALLLAFIDLPQIGF